MHTIKELTQNKSKPQYSTTGQLTLRAAALLQGRTPEASPAPTALSWLPSAASEWPRLQLLGLGLNVAQFSDAAATLGSPLIAPS